MTTDWAAQVRRLARAIVAARKLGCPLPESVIAESIRRALTTSPSEPK